MILLLLTCFLASIPIILLYCIKVLKLGYKDVDFAVKGAILKLKEKRVISQNLLVYQLWEQTLSKMDPKKEVIYYIDTKRSYTAADVEELSNQIAHYCLKKGIQAGDSVALLLENKPEYFIIWLGISKVGGRSALINHNLRNKALVYSLNVTKPKLIIYDTELEKALLDIQSEISELSAEYVSFGEKSQLGADFHQEIGSMPKSKVDSKDTASSRGVLIKDPILYVYTSGTTGLPKAAIVSHHRIWIASFMFSILFNVSSKDRVYCPLPLYHSSAGIIGLGFLFQRQASLVLRKKFSASKFTEDVRTNNCTIVQYIGELCRYLLSVPEKPEDSDNKLRLAVGNGLRPDIWKKFQTRYGIKQIGEFYAATEGGAALVNTCSKEGAIGFISPLIQSVMPVKIVKFDHKDESLVKDDKGFCIPCDTNEPGEFLAAIYKIKDVQNFSGYTQKEASEKKIVRDALKKGDQWFRSGDLLRMDSQGFVYFVDRIGDTFRWKGENCSTAEIAEQIGFFPKFSEDVHPDINVYGVTIEGKDGRAGMCALGGVSPDDFDFEAFSQHLNSHHASYARPLFLRFLKEMEITGTFKHKKFELRDEGFDPNKIKDPLYFFDGTKFIPLTKEVFDDINNGKFKI